MSDGAGHGHDGWIVPQRPPLSLKHRLRQRRLMDFYSKEAAALLAEGDTMGAKIYRQGAKSVREWLGET
jgi:hypothetical protein